jgi:UDP-N-acetylmuramate--alanine ligase
MFNLFNDNSKKIHFIGIGGISMSGLAEILVSYGYIVSGSDREASSLTRKLQQSGVEIYIGQSASNISNQDIVVYTAAIGKDNVELLRAIELGLQVMDRAEFLGYIMKSFKKTIAISGTHGKTTVTSMVSLMLLNAKLDPTIMVGGVLDAIGGNVKTGKSDYLVAEACEYKGSFLKFFPYIGFILNIDADHLDYYKDINEIQHTFIKFANLVPADGLLIGCSDDPRVVDTMDSINTGCNKLTYGLHSGDFTARNIRYGLKGCPTFEVLQHENLLGTVQMSVTGDHNVLNALSVIACGSFLKIDFATIANSLFHFIGTHRRFEFKGVLNDVTIIDDYAHHPTEIIATLNAARNYKHKKTYCVFQPHTYTRTLTLFEEFSNAFANADKLILVDIYAAREKDTGVINSQMLLDAVVRNGVDAVYASSFDDAVAYLKEHVQKGDLVITMGAGDVYKIGESFLDGSK